MGNKTVEYMEVKTFNGDRIKQLCSDEEFDNSDKVIASLRDFLDSQAGSDQKMRSAQEEWDLYAGFIDECWQNIQQEKSVTDTDDGNSDVDCYSRDCNKESGQASGKCKTPWEKMGEPLARCVADRMDDLIQSEYYRKLQLHPNASQEEFVEAFTASVSGEDCVGEGAWKFSSRREWVQDPDTGMGKEVFIPGNKTRCLKLETCNYNAERQLTKSMCESGTQEVCAQCWGKYCHFSTYWEKRCSAENQRVDI